MFPFTFTDDTDIDWFQHFVCSLGNHVDLKQTESSLALCLSLSINQIKCVRLETSSPYSYGIDTDKTSDKILADHLFLYCVTKIYIHTVKSKLLSSGFCAW